MALRRPNERSSLLYGDKVAPTEAHNEYIRMKSRVNQPGRSVGCRLRLQVELSPLLRGNP